MMLLMPCTSTKAAAAVTLLVMAVVIFSVVVSPNLLSPVAAQNLSEQQQQRQEAESRLKVETVASNLHIPWSIAFASDGRIFFTERAGNVQVIEANGTLAKQPVAKIGAVAAIGEGGLLGLALDPDFEKNHFVYLYYTYSTIPFFGSANRVSKFTEKDNALVNEQILLDKIPAASNHDGGRIKFGPDGKLYVATGDAANGSSSQDLGSLAGKILRINSDGTIPADNPFSNSPVYSYGHRNPQGFDWDPSTGKLVEAEHGPSGEKGLFAHDEVNVIEPGKNYGWPNVIGKANDTRYVDPVLETGNVTWAPSGASFYHGDKIPEWKNKFLVATLRGQHLEVMQLDTSAENNKEAASSSSVVISSEAIFQNMYGRLRDVQEGPDGYVYVLTSNTDGRGSPAVDDDKILRISPQ
ncbi:glucose/sorbosone dehydrogenase [Candidatus Nitrososphaera evergladensis SR1]|uniref:Glucose/sorbosone dehydrogenase n=2 Tax=Nitrososphaera TaxID=497726 RepID=A0A075MMY5_9ARCH|nr:glucose/sorbosone dehydrogenase [Candidatus Nitrososphaera evergladensis SR1]